MKILIVSPDYIDIRMAGPGIRYWNISLELSKYFEVVLFTPNKCSLKSNFIVKTFNKRAFKKESQDAGAILIQGTTLWKNPFIKNLNIPLVVDLYDPFIFENLEMSLENPNSSALHKASLSVLLDQIRHGDYFICASEKQRDFWIGMLAAVNRINPAE